MATTIEFATIAVEAKERLGHLMDSAYRCGDLLIIISEYHYDDKDVRTLYKECHRIADEYGINATWHRAKDCSKEVLDFYYGDDLEVLL